jgi:hypothetical protein
MFRDVHEQAEQTKIRWICSEKQKYQYPWSCEHVRNLIWVSWDYFGRSLNVCHIATKFMPKLLRSRKRIVSVQIIGWWFVCITREPSNSPLAVHLKQGKTNSVRCEERAYYLFNTCRVVLWTCSTRTKCKPAFNIHGSVHHSMNR